MPEVRPMPRAFSILWKLPLVIVAVSLSALATLVSYIFDLKENRSAWEVATYLRNFIEHGGEAWDWDDFTSVRIANPQLEVIRQRAAAIALPVTVEDVAVLRELLAEADDLAKSETAI